MDPNFMFLPSLIPPPLFLIRDTLDLIQSTLIKCRGKFCFKPLRVISVTPGRFH